MSAQEKLQHSFGRSFESYREDAAIQRKVATDLVTHLKAVGAPGSFASVLELGCGTGALTNELRQNFDISHLTLNDLTAQSAATAKLYGAAFVQGDASALELNQGYDLIISSSMVQWIKEPHNMFQSLAPHLNAGGWIAITGYGPQQFHELSAIGPAAPAPSLLLAKALSETVKRAFSDEIEILTCKEHVETLIFDTPLDVLKHLRNTGVNAKARSHWTRRDLKRFSKMYQEQFGVIDGVPLTYHPTMVIARRS